jgi:uncharacterized protein (DUF2384 family)
MTVKEANILKDIPSRVDSNITLGMIQSGKVSAKHLRAIKELTALNDEKISTWFDIGVKTYRVFKAPHHGNIKARIQEHTINILSLIKHGIEVFGTAENFTVWLEKENFFFDKTPPISFMNTNSGIKFIDDRLTAMEYGDNV